MARKPLSRFLFDKTNHAKQSVIVFIALYRPLVPRDIHDILRAQIHPNDKNSI
jgi:hypothetical protein